MARKRADERAERERLRVRIAELERRIAELEAERAAPSASARVNDFARAFKGWFWEMDADCRFTYFSPSVEDVTGVPPEWHYGKTREEIGIPDSISPEAWQAHLDTLKRRESFEHFVFQRRGPDGVKWMRTSGIPVFGPGGEFLGYRGAGADITAQVQAERRADRFEELASVDDLTGLLNRRGFLEAVRSEKIRAERYGRSITVLMLDIDHFKLVNDRFGHAAGDAVLRRIAAACEATVREPDKVGRLGGEEFGVLLPETDSGGGEFIAERLRRSVESLEHDLVGLDRVTISAGIAQMVSGQSVEEAIARADSALYRAKRNGRNRVVCAEHRTLERARPRGAVGGGTWGPCRPAPASVRCKAGLG